MRSFVKALAVLAMGLPLAASAQISGSKHDLSAGNAAVSVHAATQSQLCIFCHTPHHAIQQKLIWNHNATVAGDTFTNVSLASGTSLGAAFNPLQAPTLACLSCHDGSQAVGAVNNAGAGSTTAIAMVSAAADINGANQMIGYAELSKGGVAGVGAMDNNHPVSIPYAGQTYNGQASKAVASAAYGYYNPVSTAGCTSASGVCTAAVIAANGQAINLYGSSAAAGVECGSCHEVHNKITGNGFFLRAPQTGSQICLACHNK